MRGKNGNWELWELKGLRSSVGRVLICKISVEEVEVSWKMFKRQHSVAVKSTEY